jgi:hypothetical protein
VCRYSLLSISASLAPSPQRRSVVAPEQFGICSNPISLDNLPRHRTCSPASPCCFDPGLPIQITLQLRPCTLWSSHTISTI